METITLIIGDSSDLYEFSSKEIPVLDSNWSGSWVVSETLGGTPIIQGNLTKNVTIYNDDSLENEDYRITYSIFEPSDKEIVTYNTSLSGSILTIQGTISEEILNQDGTTSIIPVTDKYITFTTKGIFVPYSRSTRTKTDASGAFTLDIDLSKTVKTPADSFFIFQIFPQESEQLLEQTYYLSVEIVQTDTNGIPVFRKEVIQNKLKMVKQGVL